MIENMGAGVLVEIRLTAIIDTERHCGKASFWTERYALRPRSRPKTLV